MGQFHDGWQRINLSHLYSKSYSFSPNKPFKLTLSWVIAYKIPDMVFCIEFPYKVVVRMVIPAHFFEAIPTSPSPVVTQRVIIGKLQVAFVTFILIKHDSLSFSPLVG